MASVIRTVRIDRGSSALRLCTQKAMSGTHPRLIMSEKYAAEETESGPLVSVARRRIDRRNCLPLSRRRHPFDGPGAE